jgi:hypothetical protein
VTVVAAVAVVAQPRFTAGSPQPLTFVYYLDADSGAARWQVKNLPPLPAAVGAAATFGPVEPAFPWSAPYDRARAAAAPALALAAPELQVEASSIEGGKRHLRLRLLSHRGATAGSVYVPPGAGAESVLIEGHEAMAVAPPKNGARRAATQGWLDFSDVTLPPGGCEVELVLAATEPLDWYVSDRTFGLPPAGAALEAARPATSVPQQNGDVTVVARKLRI